MNQARKRTGTKKVLSMILVLVMLLSLLSMAAFTLPTAASSDGAASNDGFKRIVHIDCGRKYFRAADLKKSLIMRQRIIIPTWNWPSATMACVSCWTICP